jgi:hypothetical protein
MSVHIYQVDALDRMAAVEGERWKQQQLNPKNWDKWSFHVCLQEWQLLDPQITQAQRENPTYMNFSLHSGGTEGVIYGWHGWSRYTVRNSGEIWFIEAQSPTAAVTELARQAGFTFL